MSELKCPFCQQELVKDTPFAWNCPNEECVETDMMWGTANMWQELIRTRKALETIRLHLMTARGRFDFYDEYLVSGIDTPHARFIKEEIEKALAEITALEQNEHFADTSKKIEQKDE